MTGALAELLRAFTAAGLEPTAEHVVEAAWLARWMAPPAPAAPAVVPGAPDAPPVEGPTPAAAPAPGGGADPEPALPEAEPTPESEPTSEPPPEPDTEPHEDVSEPEPDSGSDADGYDVGVYLPAGPGTGGAAGQQFQAPAAPALPRPLELARALRPLRRRVPSRARFVLDVGETIRRFADERLADPVLRPARERWLRLALVTDTGPGSDLWHETATEFRALLTGLGGFRDVRAWSLDSGCRPPRLTPGTRAADGPPRHPNELIDPAGRTLTVVLSPCVGPGWYDGGVPAILREWARRGPVLLVPLLPEFLWPRTALAGVATAEFAAPAAGAANVRLLPRLAEAWPGDEAPVGVYLPAAVLEPASLRRWARMTAGRPGAAAPGFVLDPDAVSRPADAGTAPTPAARVERFRRSSSPLARELAGLLAAAPVISLPIVRLVRQAMLPRAGQPHEAEVLFGGLLERRPGDGDPRFEFAPGVRGLLLDAVPTDRSVPVLAAVSDYLGEHLTGGRKFSAVLIDPTVAAGELMADASPFARIAAEVLARAGGEYAKIVARKRVRQGHIGTQQALAEMLVGTTWQKQNGETIRFHDRTTFHHCFDRQEGGEPDWNENTYHLGATLGLMTLVWRRDGYRSPCTFSDAFTTFTEGNNSLYTWTHLSELDRPEAAQPAIEDPVPDPSADASPTGLPAESAGEPPLESATDETPLQLALEAEPEVGGTGVLLQRRVLEAGGPLRLGSNPESCDWWFDDARMEPAHATIERDGDRVRVRVRKGSYTGIRFQDRVVGGCEVAVGEWFVIGGTRFTLRAEPPVVEPEVEASLEALTRIESLGAEYRWQYTLHKGESRLGRDPTRCEWAVPEDEMLSRFQSVLEWDGSALTVANRGAQPPEYPNPPPNQIWFRNRSVERCRVKPGEWFVIGQTRFTVRPGAATEGPAHPDTGRGPRAELEAITEKQFDSRRAVIMKVSELVKPRRFALLPRPMRLGRDADTMDVAIPDDQISRFQAVLNWDAGKERLTVQTRPAIPPAYPTPPANRTLVFDDKQKKLVEAPGGTCVVGVGESFWIGQTRFTVHAVEESEPENSAAQTIVPRQELRPRARLEGIPFANPGAALRALEQLPPAMRVAHSEQALFRQVLKMMMEAMPRADAAAAVRVADGERLTLVESRVRSPVAKEWLRPPWRPIHRAVTGRCGCWLVPGEGGVPDTRTDDQKFDDSPLPASWEVCAPLRDGSNYALYVTGQVGEQWDQLDAAARDRITSGLTQYQRVAEVMVGMVEPALHALRLTQRVKAASRPWPFNARKHLNNIEELERMLTPKETEITTLFWVHRERLPGSTQPLQLQRETAAVRDVVCGAITDREGIVSGFPDDTLQAFWGWPERNDKQIELAARSALAIGARANPSQFGIGIAHGTAVAGRVVENGVGLGVFGPAVNAAERLAALTGAFGVPILVSQAVAEAVAASDPYGREMRTRVLGHTRVRGFPEPLTVHELYSAASPSIQEWLMDDWRAAVELFAEGNWAEAYDLLSSQFADDPAARFLMRVMDKTRRRPAKDWDGSFNPLAFAE